jgi:hypothetical protein
MKESISELESKLRRLKMEEYEKDRLAKLKLEEEFRKKTKVDVYTSDDYCGMSNGKYSFYYGYEVTKCPVKSHKDDDDCYTNNCDLREWCFTADIDGKEVLRLTRSELWEGRADEPFFYLLAGIAHFLKTVE